MQNSTSKTPHPSHLCGNLLFILLISIFILTSCSPMQSTKTASTRPACVTLAMYNNVIQQVMNITPDWSPLTQDDQGFQTNWEVQADKGKHVLTARLTSDGCVCATSATSHFESGRVEGKTAGYMQGAAVAPVSELDYTSAWLEPKILVRCTLAFILRQDYKATTLMRDGTTWELACTRDRTEAYGIVITSLRISSSACTAPSE